jgi:hypothetical protein
MYNIDAMYTLANNRCDWQIYRKTGKCNKKCVGKYCAVHNAQSKRGMQTFPCTICGRGINHLGICYKCKYISKHKKNNIDRIIN